MFSPESYITPYIGAYLGKYVQNFNDTQFQVSLWQGGATFNNVNLNLEAIEEELHLPLHLISGHIHELKINVPWTKLTSEPIVVNINTIEITISLGHPNTKEDEFPMNSARIKNAAARRRSAETGNPQIPPAAPGYMQSLISKILHNVKYVFQNVILKYVEKDVVLSLNVKKVTLCSVDGDWEQAFVELLSPEFLLRQKLSCSDLTVCLDRTDDFGRVSYMDPLLYKCSFDIRILSQYHGAFASSPYFTRLDMSINEMEFSVTDEQIPLVIRMYNLFMTVLSLAPRPETIKGVEEVFSDSSFYEEEGQGLLLTWASWAVGWVPQLVFGDPESEVPDEPCEFENPVLHLGIQINMATIVIRGNECGSEPGSNTNCSVARSKHSPYLEVGLHGVIGDIVVRGLDSHLRFGVSKMTLHGVGNCPCGNRDCEDDLPPDPSCPSSILYFTLGQENENTSNNTLFDPTVEVRPAAAYDFDYNGHEDRCSDEHMLARTPGLAFDCIDVLPPETDDVIPPAPASEPVEETIPDEPCPCTSQEHKSASRIVVGPWRLNICTGFIHRIKRVYRHAITYNFAPYETLANLIQTTVCIYYKIRMDKFQLVMYDGDTGDTRDADNQIVANFEGLKSEIDMQEVYTKVTFQLGGLSLRSYKRKESEEEGWELGECLGLILSSGDEIEPNLTILKPTIEKFEEKTESASHTSLPVSSRTSVLRLDEGPPVPEPDRSSWDEFFRCTYTRVQTTNFHKRSGCPSPNSRLNGVLEKKYGKDTELHVPPDQERTQFISEFDVKVKPVDLVLSAAVFTPFLGLMKEISTFVGTDEEGVGRSYEVGMSRFSPPIPRWNNNTMPLIYWDGGRVRVFLKSPASSSPDTTVIQFTSAVISSQSENPLHRTLIRPDLFVLAEEANILNIPGSPIEDRQYVLDLTEVSVFTCTWADIEVNSLVLGVNGSPESLPSPQTYEWTSAPQTQAPPYQIFGMPILEKLNVTVSLSPAIVYERHPIRNYNPIVIGGHALELNISSEIDLMLNVDQITLLRGFLFDLDEMSRTFSEAPSFQPESEPQAADAYKDHEPYASENSSVRDSGVESGTGTSQQLCRSQTRRDSAPIDVFLAAPRVRITTYNFILKYRREERSLEQDLGSIVGVVPLAYFHFGQPYLVFSTSYYSQRLEFSIFDLSVGLGSGHTRKAKGFTVPSRDEYSIKLFETMEGERNPKTGMIQPFFIAKATDFVQHPFKLNVAVAWPTKFSLSKKRVDLMVKLFDSILNIEPSASDLNIVQAEGEEEPHNPEPTEGAAFTIFQFLFSYVHAVEIATNQIIFLIHEEPPGLPKAAIELSCTSMNASLTTEERFEDRDLRDHKIRVALNLDSIVVSTVIGDRSDIFMSPWCLKMVNHTEWHSWIAVPIATYSVSTDPISVYLGPQNVLAFLQIYHTFGNYIQRFLIAEEEEIIEILEALPTGNRASSHYKDDLRSGSFKYVKSITSAELPEVYHLAFCDAHRTMTWRYPEQRSLTRIESVAVPIYSSSCNTPEPVELTCLIEFWDDSMFKFVHYAVFIVSERKGERVKITRKDFLEGCASNIWRITIQTLLEEEAIKLILRPEVLAAALRIDSVFMPKLIQKLKLFLEIPRISIHIVNQHTYGGKIPEERLQIYSFGGLPQVDQPVATFETSMNTVSVNMWWQRATVEWNSFIKLSVMDYAYLTDIDVVDPFNFQIKYNLIEEDSKQVYSSFEAMTKPITLKIGGSALHTIISSVSSWMQVLKAFYGSSVDISKNHFQHHINMTQMVICNDTSSRLGLIQVDTKKPQVVHSRQCFAYNWTTHKVRPECCVGIFEGSRWAWGPSFGMNQKEQLVRKIGNKAVFIKIEKLYTSQKMVTLSGNFTVANALDAPVEVGVLCKDSNQELQWSLDSRAHGPSQILDLADLEQVRFKLSELGVGNQGWSHAIGIKDLREAKNKSLYLELYREENETLSVYNVWCSLVEESVQAKFGAPVERAMVVISPFFRVRSALSIPTSVTVATAKKDSEVTFVLPGRNEEMEISFLGSPDVVHHLTFQTNPTAQPSSPAIPLLPGGPALENTIPTRPIDNILRDITKLNSVSSVEEVWPFSGENLEVRQWVLGNQPESGVNVNFMPWIEGLPSVLVDAKPWALFVNLSGGPILFKQPGDEEVFATMNRSAFSPAKIGGKFLLGIEAEKRSMCWSNEMELSEELPRSDIHYVNSNWKVPINCFSRIEIGGDGKMTYFTLETKVHRGIQILIIRPTFYVQNKTEMTLIAKGLSIYHKETPPDAEMGLDTNYIQLDPNYEWGPNDTSALSLLTFNLDWNPLTETEGYKPGMKYVGLKYGSGPWWFVQLMKFESVFNNLSAPQGIPVKRVAVSIPNCQPHWVAGTDDNLLEVNIPLIVCWTCKNGQVWISISADVAPQVVLQNDTPHQLVYGEGNGHGEEPIREAEHFPQYHCLPPYSRGSYTFPSTQAKFPVISQCSSPPLFLVGRYVKGIEAIYKNVRRLNMLCRLCGKFHWSTHLKVDGGEEDTQLIQLGHGPTQLHLKVHIEKLGLTYFIFIDEMSGIEVSAKIIRSRILDKFSSGAAGTDRRQAVELSRQKVHFAKPEVTKVATFDPHEVIHVLSPKELETQVRESTSSMLLLRPSLSLQARLSISIGSSDYPYFQYHIVFPEIRVILTDDFTNPAQKREIISLTVEDIFVERLPKTGQRVLRVLEYKKSESLTLAVRIGDIQIDNALYQEKRYDFPVLLKKEEPYKSLTKDVHYSLDELPTLFTGSNLGRHHFMLTFQADFSICPDRDPQILNACLACEPFAVNVEDQFLEYIYPAVAEFFNVITERVPQLRKEHELIRAQQAYTPNPSRHTFSTENSSHSEVFHKNMEYTTTILSLLGERDLDPRLGSRRSSISEMAGRSRISSVSYAASPVPPDDDDADSMGALSTTRSFLDLGSPDPFPPPAAFDGEVTFITRRDSAVSMTASIMDPDSCFEIRDMYQKGLDVALTEKLVEDIVFHRVNYLLMPSDVLSIMGDLSRTIHMDFMNVAPVTVFVTMRMSKKIYLAVDHSPLYIDRFWSGYVATTYFTMGQSIAEHFLTGAIYRAANPVRLIGSLELLGSPGTLVRSLGTGVKDFVVYPFRGISQGPFGFIAGLNYGCKSLIRNVSAGTLTSVTNWAWSVSRNIDRITLDEEEQQLTEEGRRVPIDGVRDGLVQGLSGFGIRLLGAIGGLTHHPMQAVMDGPSPFGVFTGIGKGLFGVVAKPIGATVELVAMTGQGLLQGAGWTPKYQRKYDVFLDEAHLSTNSLLKYAWKLGLGDRLGQTERLLLVVDAMQPVRNSLIPVSLVITTEHLYIMDTTLDQVSKKDPIASTSVRSTDFYFDPSSSTELFNALQVAKLNKEGRVFKIF